MIITSVTIKRGTATLYTGQLCQIDNLTEEVVADHHEVPMDIYKWMTFPGYAPQVRQGDLLIDERNTDPNTGASVQYRIRGNPEIFAFHHSEAHIQHTRTK